MYNCSTNHSLVAITWLLNKTVSALTLASYGVTAPGVGTPVSSLTIPGLVNPFNNTEVQCVAYGHGVGDFSPPPVILRIQGRLEHVNGFTAVLSTIDCYQFCWTPPFTLHFIPYQVYLLQLVTYHVNRTNSVLSVVGRLHSHWLQYYNILLTLQIMKTLH